MKIDDLEIMYPDEFYRLNDECERFPQTANKFLKKVRKIFKSKENTKVK